LANVPGYHTTCTSLGSSWISWISLR